jgi:hypothetical protein
MKHTFYKENGLWYIDLPEFLEAGLGTTANLLMVDGADTFLDYLSNNGNRVSIEMDVKPFDGHTHTLNKIDMGKNQSLLDAIGHAPVDYGAYYSVPEHNNHHLWLCPVTEYVFGGNYPDNIYIQVVPRFNLTKNPQ